MTAKLRANLDALAVLNDCRGEARWATADEQTVLARWSGWGSVPQVFDLDDERHADERTELRRLLGTEEAWSQARRTTLNAHYTSADVVQAMWGAVSALGVDGDVSVLEPDVLRGELCRGNAGPDDHGHQEGGAEELGEQAARQGRCLNVGHTRMLTQPQWLSQT